MREQLIFHLNGRERRVHGVAPDLTLLEFLRSDHLTATKEGCAEGDCGACSVAVGTPNDTGGLSWKAVNSCLFLIGQADGRHILTAEGIAELGANGAAHAVQTAMAEGHGTQCGYCTPGFITTMWTHWRTGLETDRETVLDTLAGNLCRCTGYRPIVEAMQDLPPVLDTDINRDTPVAAALSALRADEIAFKDPAAPENTYIAPTSLDRLLEIWDASCGAAPWSRESNTWLVAGATDLGLRITKEGAKPKLILSLERVKELHRLEETDSHLIIGAALPYNGALSDLDRLFPGFGEMVWRIGATQVRNMGSIGGNLGTASPIGDTWPCLIALGAEVEIAHKTGTRRIALEDFVTGYRMTQLQPGELISAIHIPKLAEGAEFKSYKLAKRVDQDISTVSAAFLKIGDTVHAAFGGVAATPIRAKAFEVAFAKGGIDAAITALQTDISPMSDARGSADYRRLAAANLARRFFHEVLSETPVETRLEALV